MQWSCQQRNNLEIKNHRGITRWLSGKESAFQFRRCNFDPWVGKIPWRRQWQLTPVFFPGESHGQRSLVGYSSWGHKTWTQLKQLRKHTISSSGILSASVQFSSVQSLSCVRLCDSMQHARPPRPSPPPRAYSNSCPSSQ